MPSCFSPPVSSSVRRMNILTWNCNGALRNKLDALAQLEFDIAVIQECEDPDRSTSSLYKTWAKNYLWVGPNKNKGVGVFASPEVSLAPVHLDPGRLELFLPCRFNDSFLLVATWARQADSPTFQYIGQLWKFIQAHRGALSDEPTVIAGDLNSNVRWDKWDRWWNHSDVVKELSEIGMESVYHLSRGIAQGEESEPTFYLQRNLSKPYHIDYVFAPVEWLAASSAWVGGAEKWLQWSDHMPLLVRVDIPNVA